MNELISDLNNFAKIVVCLHNWKDINMACYMVLKNKTITFNNYM